MSERDFGRLDEKAHQTEVRVGRLEDEVYGRKRESRDVRRLRRAVEALGAEVEKIKGDQRGWRLALIAAFIVDIVVHLFVTP